MPSFEVDFDTRRDRKRGDDKPHYLGHRGYGLLTGIHANVLTRNNYQSMTIQAISTKGMAPSKMEIPLDKAREFAHAILALVDEIEGV